ncbi:MAG: peptide chain release factor 2 [Candidatus Zipacnadales bacterium]
MLVDLKREVLQLRESVTKVRIVFDLAGKVDQLSRWEKTVEESGFWDDPEAAQQHMQKISQLRQFIEPWERLEREIEDLETLIDLGMEESDESVEAEAQVALEGARKKFGELELVTVLNGEHDRSNAILSINAGAGGTEACDWVEMLLRMYSLWAERRKYGFSIVDSVPGEGAGFRNVTVRVTGEWAYGYLKAEVGVHRLVRISPFDANKRRHTSFAAVDVVPEIDETIEVEIKPDELRVETFRSSGAGGQHVNKTDSAVRITHLPTGTVVSCQNERSQHSNRRTAMTILRAKLYERERKKRQAEIDALRSDQQNIEWGSQIRSYVLQPYMMVKDHRTNMEVSDALGVLNGDLDELMRAYLQASAGREG